MTGLGDEFKKHFENNPIADKENHHAESERIEELLMIVLKNQTKATTAMKLSAIICTITNLTVEVANGNEPRPEKIKRLLSVAETINRVSITIANEAIRKQ